MPAHTPDAAPGGPHDNGPGGRTAAQGPTDAPHLRWLAIMAVTYALTHHIGFALASLGSIGQTRWADWVDLLTPYLVLLPAAAALHAAAGASRRIWILYLLGAITYVEGHGIHLSANSISNVEPSRLVHLWDEVVGHYAWYGGLTIVLVALAAHLACRPPAHGPLQPLAALLVGVTFTTNALEGGTAIAAIAVSTGFIAWGWITRATLGRALLMAFVPALILLVAYGVLQRGFPEPSDIGWI